MDYVENSIKSIRELRGVYFNVQFLPSVTVHKRRNDNQYSNLLGQLWGTEKLLCRFSERPTSEKYRPFLRELDCVVGRAITLVKDPTDQCEHYPREHYLEVFLDLRWWTWVMIYMVDNTSLRTEDHGERYFVKPKGVLDPASSRLASFK